MQDGASTNTAFLHSDQAERRRQTMRTQTIFIPDSVEEQGGTTMELSITDRRTYYAVKRVMDILMAGLLLIVTLPIMALAAVLIYIYSPGPIFFIQERVGAKRT